MGFFPTVHTNRLLELPSSDEDDDDEEEEKDRRRDQLTLSREEAVVTDEMQDRSFWRLCSCFVANKRVYFPVVMIFLWKYVLCAND